MTSIDLRRTTHFFEKQNLVTQSSSSGAFDNYKCRLCGLTGKRYGISEAVVTKSAKASEACPKAVAPVGLERVMISKSFHGAVDDADELKPGTIHAVVPPPKEYAKKYPNNFGNVWVMGTAETPVRLIGDEFSTDIDQSKVLDMAKQKVSKDPDAIDAPAGDDVPESQLDPEMEAALERHPEPADIAEEALEENEPAAETPAPKKKANKGSTKARKKKPAKVPAQTPETPVAAPEPVAPPVLDPDSQALVAYFGNTKVKKLEELTAAEQADLDVLEDVVARGIDGFIETGKALKEINDRMLFRKTHKNFIDYARDKFQLGKSQAYKTMKSAEAAEFIKDTAVEVDGAVVEASNVSIKAAGEFESISDLVDTTDLSAAQVAAFTADFDRFALELAIECAPKINGKAQLSQKLFQSVKEVLMDAATLKAVEIDGEHHEVSAAHIAVTRGTFEAMLQDKQRWADDIKARQERLNTPQTIPAKGVDTTPAADAPTVEIRCSKHGKTDLREFKVIFAGFVLSCGCKWRRVDGEDMPTYMGNDKP